ncbi:MAG TPA: DUF3786 domain-containing protein, partial [Acidobacteriota bacterium]|nr:DUF3786 domain-containing protein [Acidobacteriota bacterium]
MSGKISSSRKISVPLSIYQKRYGKLDPAEVAARTGVFFISSADGSTGAFTLTILENKLSASWPEFSLQPVNKSTCPTVLYEGEACILMIRYLLEGHSEPSHGNWLPYRKLPWGEVY